MAIKKTYLCIILLFSVILNGKYASVLIVPEQILSLIRTAIQTIPPIKKGTDSRVGFGFALGNHADFQVMFELGPQSNTAPVGSSLGARGKQRRSALSGKVLNTQARQYLQQWVQKLKTSTEGASEKRKS